jgi:Ca-activated chloride channel family protein
VLPAIDLRRIEFGEPVYLALLGVPAVLLALWTWAAWARRADTRRLMRGRRIPVRERFAVTGDLPFWLCVIVATACLIVAAARPRGPATMVRQGGVDLVILQDASASMRVQDVEGDRWQRSMKFLRTLGDALSWKSDRIALAVFAHIAAPQVRLTTDPNTLFFFLDHLDTRPPFRIEEDTTWDTNLELGIHWGLRMLERDEEIHGRSPNAKLFLVLSDGELWTGEVEKALAETSSLNIPVFVVGVGSLGGGRLPAFLGPDGKEIRDPETPSTSRLDRGALQALAAAAGGQYFELDRDGDRRVANAIIDTGKRLAPSLGLTEDAEELYWYVLLLAAAFLFVGLLFVTDRPALWLQLAGGVAVFVWVSTVFN